MPRRRRAPPMTFGMTKPCVDCPFLAPRDFPLQPERAAEIAEELEHKTFVCHKTIGQRPQQHCAGALIIMLNNEMWGDMQQIAMRLGMFDPDKLDAMAPVYETFEDFVRARGGVPRRWRGRRNRE
jgi:hypothetical protein